MLKCFTTMVPLVSFLAALRILTEAQSCNNGLGKLVYEKVSDYRLNGLARFGNNKAIKEVITRTELPMKVLEECVRRCQEDRLTVIQNCLSFDFVPGKRRSSPFRNLQNSNSLASGQENPNIIAEYEQSSCTFYNERGSPDGEDTLVKQDNAWHYNEICLSSTKVSTQCPNRIYVFERIPGYMFNGNEDKEISSVNRTECEDKCLNEHTFVCRSASFDRKSNKCRLSKETRYMNPKGFKLDPNSDYLENICLPRAQMCAWTAFILETNKELDGAYERVLLSAKDFQECSNYCLDSLEKQGFLCRSFIFDEAGQTCIIYDEDPLSHEEIGQGDASQSSLQQYKSRPLKQSPGNLYRVLCVNNERDRSAAGSNFISGLYPTISQTDPRYGAGASGYQIPFPGPVDSSGYNQATSGLYSGYQHSWGYQPPNGFGGQRDHHRGGFTYEDPSASSRSGYGGYGIAGRYPTGYNVPYASYSNQHVLSHPPPSGFGMPYNQGFSGSHNSISAPFSPQPIPQEKCKFASQGASMAKFNRMGFGARIRSQYVFKIVRAERVDDCERACLETRDFICKSFNYRGFFPDNCELSHLDSKQFKVDNPTYFEQNTQYDYYERSDAGGVPGTAGPVGTAECLEVTQTCTPEGMEFTIKTPEGFYGRIYTYGFYDSCFFDGNGGTTSVLRISRANGFPRCGTQQYGDAMTNIVVVQFNDYVQTSRDKKYNLTCYFSGPGEAVVTSSYLDTKTDGRYPTQIEHLPAQNILTSNVVLRVLYRGTPTNTIVVGDLLTFRLEARGQYRYDYLNSDIFATNVIAKDPYTGRQVHLIDSRGCPVDLYVFPELHKTPDGGLEAEFYAFKIPDSNFLVFQATVRTCRGPCEPVICTDRGRGPGSFPSWGRKKRSLAGDHNSTDGKLSDKVDDSEKAENGSEDDPEEEVHELLRVYLSRDDIPEEETRSAESGGSVSRQSARVCVPQSGYYTLVTTLTVLVSVVTVLAALGAVLLFKRTDAKFLKDFHLPPPTLKNLQQVRTKHQRMSEQSKSHQKFDDPSEPIYTDPSLFERSRSLRSLTVISSGTEQSLDLPLN